MRKTAHLLTGLLAALILTACGGNNGQPIAERDTVSVSGEGTIKARPDIFNLVAVARERGDDVAAMKDEVDRQVQAMLIWPSSCKSTTSTSPPATSRSPRSGNTSRSAS